MIAKMPLRLKLLASLAIPLVLLSIFGINTINSSFENSTLAAEQQDEVDRTVALFQLANAVRAERDVVLIEGFTDEAVAARRDAVDQLLERLSNPSAGYSEEVVAGLETLALNLGQAREAVGGSASQMVDASNETAVGFDSFARDTLSLVNFDEDLVVDPAMGQQLATLQLAVELSESLNLESLSYYQTSQLSRPEQTSRVLRDAADLGQRSIQLEQTLSQLATDEANARFTDLSTGPEYEQLFALRETMADAAVRNRAIEPLPVEVLSGYGLRPALEAYQAELLLEVQNEAISGQSEARSSLVTTVLLAAAIGTFVLILTVALYRSIRKPLRRLTEATLKIAEEDLPEVVARMRTQSEDDATFEVTPLESQSKDEIGQLVDSFNKLHLTAVSLASEQAASRRVAAEMFANLGHRNQKLLSQALEDMDDLEREENNPERLGKLFAVDQKITRMRRNAESLLVLAGTQTPRQWSQPAPVEDVIRASMAEVENFERVQVRVEEDLYVKGAAVADLTHLLAELVENALRFSPPTTNVEVRARVDKDDVVIYVIDEGLGLSPQDLAAANERILAAADSDETPSKRLGHFVVGRLGARHGIPVDLREEPIKGGVVARVRLSEVVETNVGGDTSDDADNTGANADQTVGSADDTVSDVDQAESPEEVASEPESTPEPAATAQANGSAPSAESADSDANADADAGPDKIKRRVPGANLPSSLKSAPKSSDDTTDAPESSGNSTDAPEDTRSAFSGFQQSTNGEREASTPSAEADASDGTDGLKPHPDKIQRRVPGKNMPTALRRKTDVPADQDSGVPERSEADTTAMSNAFSGFQKSSAEANANESSEEDK